MQVGAGIRIPPNSSRLSLSWGFDFDVLKKEVSCGNRFVDWHGNKLLDVNFSNVESEYGAPYYFVHRADLVAALVEAVRKRGNVNLLVDTRIIEYDFARPAVKDERGHWYKADVIVVADGIKSTVRDTINGDTIEPIDTGDVAYRILVPAAPLLNDPEMRHLVSEPWATHWMGPEGHAVGYPLRGGELYNVIIDVTHRTDLGEPVGEGEWMASAGNEQLVERFKDWCPEVKKLCSLTGKYLKWRLADFDKLKQWVHPSGKVVLLGDCCHPMMPYMAQGAAQATEDAATLAAALAAKQNLTEALALYQRHRLPRAAYVARNTRVLQEWLHLYDGPEQQRRDKLMGSGGEDNPIFWANKGRRDWLFGHDALKVDETDGQMDIPSLPPLPASEASVYH